MDVSGTTVRALAYPALTGAPEPGDRVLLNTSALELGLGTGGYALVIAVPGRLPAGPAGPGHLVKARYTPLQACVAGADEQGSAHHDVLRDADDLGGMPVVIADLHSALPAVLAGYYAARPAGAPRPAVAYVMLDGGALPAWFSRTAAALTASPAATPENPHRVPVPRLPGPWATTASCAPSTCRAASRPLCSVTVSRSPPNDCPVEMMPASQPSSLSAAAVRENQAGRAPPSSMT